MAPNQFYKNYSDNGFFFSKELLTRYCLSLYTKPFVLLSGISGTGKSKIAQLFTIPGTRVAEPEEQKALPSSEDHYILLTVTDGVLNGDGRGNLRFSDAEAIYEQEELAAIHERIQELRESGDGGNITDPVRINIKYGEQTVPASVYLQRANSPLLRVRFVSPARDENPYDSRPFIRENFQVNDVLKLKKIGEKLLEVVRLNDDDIIAEMSEFNEEEAGKVKNTCFISVKSNWTDSTDVFGYYNVIEQKYHLTPLLKFILTAKEYPDIPFFLILDEMNLSKVEHYFSDVLSCLESRHIINGEIHQEPVHLHNSSYFAESDDPYFDLVPSNITIPENIYITGTVNIDETTYMFSPKVLDRANVIEFNEVDLESYLSGNNNQDDAIFKLAQFPPFGRLQLASRSNFQEIPDDTQDFFLQLNTLLFEHNLHFGYRTINEVSLFIVNTQKFISQEKNAIDRAVDIQIVQKILPKLNGTLAKLEEPIKSLLAFLTNRTLESLDDYESIEGIDATGTKYPLSIQKLKNMYVSLYKNGFASFIE